MVVQRGDNAIHWIDHYRLLTIDHYSLVGFAIYPVWHYPFLYNCACVSYKEESTMYMQLIIIVYTGILNLLVGYP